MPRAMPLRGVVADRLPWTPEEDARLRETYQATGYPGALAALPTRTRLAICHRLKKLGIETRLKRWTEGEDRRLRNMWGGGYWLARMAHELPGRSEQAIYTRAVRHLGLSSLPTGYEYLETAAERCGFTPRTLRKIMRATGYAVGPAFARPSPGKRQRRWHIVDSFDADEAVEAWLQRESVNAAAERIGVSRAILRGRLRRLGVSSEKGRHLHVTDEQVAQAMAGETVAEAARRLGVSWMFLRRRLAAIGVDWQRGPRNRLRVSKEQLRAALELDRRAA